MAAKKKTAKKKRTKRAPKKAPRKASKRRAPKRKAVRKKAKRKASKARTVARGKQGQLRITVTKTGAGFQGRVHAVGGGSMPGAQGSTAAEALRNTKALLSGKRPGASGGAKSLREAKLRRFCASAL